MTDDKDYMASMPEELSTLILSHLDAESLVACSSVNETWNRITNYVSPREWSEACQKAGINVSSKNENEKDWKVFVSAMVRRMKAVKNSACFSTVPFNSCRSSCDRVKAIYRHNGKLAIAYKGGDIEIWNLPEDRRIEKFDCEFEPSYLKFDDEILVAATIDGGEMSSWTIKSGKKNKNYVYGDMKLTSFDFLTQCDILVGSFITLLGSSGIYVWNLRNDIESGEKLQTDRRQNSLIVRVLLALHPDSEQRRTSCYLFSLAVDCVGLWEVEFQSEEFSSQKKQLLEFPSNLKPLPLFKICKETGLLFDGKTLCILPPTNFLAVWNSKTKIARYLEYDDRTTSLIGIGGTYLVYEIRQKGCLERLIKTDRGTGEITKIDVPGSNLKDGFYFGIGKKSWYYSINGKNDLDDIHVSITDDEIGAWVTKFEPRGG